MTAESAGAPPPGAVAANVAGVMWIGVECVPLGPVTLVVGVVNDWYVVLSGGRCGLTCGDVPWQYSELR